MNPATAERPASQQAQSEPEEFDRAIVALQHGNGALVVHTSADLAIRAELDVQITTAKTFPRNPNKCIENALAMATYNNDIAEGCIYAKPIGRDKVLRGCSIRLAEIMISTWGNIRVQPRIVEMDARFVTVECEVWDLESNVKTAWVCRRRLTDKYGKPYAENVVENTIAAATAIAMRNATFKVIPKAYADIVYEACAKIIIGDAKSLADKRTRVLSELAKLGAQEKVVLAFLGVTSSDLIDGEMLVSLRGLGNSIRDGEVSIEDAFSTGHATNGNGEPARGTQAVKDRLQQSAAAPQAPEPPDLTLETPSASQSLQEDLLRAVKAAGHAATPTGISAAMNAAVKAKRLTGGEWLTTPYFDWSDEQLERAIIALTEIAEENAAPEL